MPSDIIAVYHVFIVMLSVFMLNFVTLNVIILRVVLQFSEWLHGEFREPSIEQLKYSFAESFRNKSVWEH
jgi:hypothetical protein